MATWVACIVETKSRDDFLTVARELGIRSTGDTVPPYALIDCHSGFDFNTPDRLAAELSRRLGATVVGFVVQTNSDCHTIHTYVNGNCVRCLDYDRDRGGWCVVDGAPQPWERVYFFGGGDTGDEGIWPDMLDDEISDTDRARYDEARRAGDASPVLSLLHPSSTAPMWRVCASFGIARDQPPTGTWKKESFWTRIFGSS
jgi:hypothetical protein